VDFVKMNSRYVEMSANVRVPEARFIVCGRGEDYETLRQQAEASGAASRFEFRGYVPDINAVLERLDVFGYPLCEDNYSSAELVLQEAMAAGVPPVVLPHGGAGQVVIHNYTGLVARNEEEYSRAVEYLYEHPEERARLSRNAEGYARKHFDAASAAREFDAILADLLAEPKKRLSAPTTGETRTGADQFIESLGAHGEAFRVSRKGGDLNAVLRAEEWIARTSPLLAGAATGGILHYRGFYPSDALLCLWAGLVKEEQGRTIPALAEYGKAQALGLGHWRAAWYTARTAVAGGLYKIARNALEPVLLSEPYFLPARKLMASLERKVGQGLEKPKISEKC
jgi:hypothetical protein